MTEERELLRRTAEIASDFLESLDERPVWAPAVSKDLRGRYRSHRRGLRDSVQSKEHGVNCIPFLSYNDARTDKRARRADAEIVRPLADTDYGSREFMSRDPEGNIWSFGTYRPE